MKAFSQSCLMLISNCVLNLCKPAILESRYKLLKPGGEMYFSDVYSNRCVSIELQKNSVLWGECVCGALYWNDFVNTSKRAGFRDPPLVEDSRISLGNKKMQSWMGLLETYSLFRNLPFAEVRWLGACLRRLWSSGSVQRQNSSWSIGWQGGRERIRISGLHRFMDA
jgi:hypothetical protein